MPRHHPCCSAGSYLRVDEPVWEPLLEAVGDRVAGPFMWMYASELHNGAVVHAYKHSYTRRYLFLTAELEAYRYSACGGYSKAPLHEAIEEAVLSWFVADTMEPDDAPAIRAAIARAREPRDGTGA